MEWDDFVIREINTKITILWTRKQFDTTVQTLSCILHDMMHPYMTIKDQPHTSNPYFARSVYIMMTTSQSAADDVKMHYIIYNIYTS